MHGVLVTFTVEQAEVRKGMGPGVLLTALCASGGVVAVKALFPVGAGLCLVGCAHALCTHLCVWMRCVFVCLDMHICVYLCVFTCVNQSVETSGAISPGS